jgi:hypothetical protein
MTVPAVCVGCAFGLWFDCSGCVSAVCGGLGGVFLPWGFLTEWGFLCGCCVGVWGELITDCVLSYQYLFLFSINRFRALNGLNQENLNTIMSEFCM